MVDVAAGAAAGGFVSWGVVVDMVGEVVWMEVKREGLGKGEG